MTYALDTNGVIALFAGNPKIVQKVGEIQKKEQLSIPAIVFGELCFGANNSTKLATNMLRVQEFAAEVNVLDADFLTAQFYGSIKADLRAKGRPIPDNDIWIASATIQHGLTLLTNDRHFTEVDGLSIEGW